MLCITKEQIDSFKKALKGRKIDVVKLMEMTSEARTKFFEKYVGESAKSVNTLFEEKLILKNRIQRIKNWASKVGEVGRYDPARKTELANLMSEYKARQQERMFNVREHESFLSDLVEEKLGVRINKAEAQTIYDLQAKTDKLFKKYDPKLEKWESDKAGAEYGASKVIYSKYIENIKNGDIPVKDMLQKYSKEIKEVWKDDKFEATGKIINDAISGLNDTLINAVASWDNSFMGRQGAITLTKNPKVWWNMAKNSVKDFYQSLKGNKPEDVAIAEIYRDPDFLNGNYEKAKITFGIEEEIPIKLLEKTPLFGKVFEASDVAFFDSSIRAKSGLFKMMKKTYEGKGIELTDTILKDMGSVVNAIAARGNVGRIGGSPIIKLLLWAPRMLKADWDVLTGHTFGLGLKTKQARIEAAKTITNVVIATAGISAMAEAMGAEVEKDPRSTDFLKIKVGNTRINTPFARGIPQIVTLFSRLATQKTKNSAGIFKELNSGDYGSRTLFDVGLDFLVNKTTPPASTVISFMRGADFKGDKPTAGATAFRFLPISVQNFVELKDDSSSMAIFGAFADIFGISANTYSSTERDWGEDTGVVLEQFKEKVGEVKFEEANDLFNSKVEEWMKTIKTNEKYKALSNDDKQKVITKKKGEIKTSIFNQYGFKYRAEKKTKLPKF